MSKANSKPQDLPAEVKRLKKANRELRKELKTYTDLLKHGSPKIAFEDWLKSLQELDPTLDISNLYHKQEIREGWRARQPEIDSLRKLDAVRLKTVYKQADKIAALLKDNIQLRRSR